jgi:hypothetical protein
MGCYGWMQASRLVNSTGFNDLFVSMIVYHYTPGSPCISTDWVDGFEKIYFSAPNQNSLQTMNSKWFWSFGDDQSMSWACVIPEMFTTWLSKIPCNYLDYDVISYHSSAMTQSIHSARLRTSYHISDKEQELITCLWLLCSESPLANQRPNTHSIRNKHFWVAAALRMTTFRS